MHRELLESIANGEVGITKACRIAAGAARDRTGSPMNAALAHLGTCGKNPQNLHRDLMRHCKRFGQAAEIKAVQVDLAIHLATGGFEMKRVPLLAPHEITWWLHSYRPAAFREIFLGAPSDLADFWSASSGAEWFISHPLADLARQVPDRVVPCRLHGDDAPVRNNIPALCLSLSSPLSWMVGAARSIFPIFFLPLKNLAEGGEEHLYRVVKWSCDALVTGQFPTKDWLGNTFTKEGDPWRYNMRGESIAGGLLFALVEILGDWKWLKEGLMLRNSYRTKEICMFCRATKDSSSPLSCYDYRPEAGWRLRTNKRTYDDFLAEYGDSHRPWLSRIRGFHSHMIRYDFMHTFCCMGVASWVCGNTLDELLETSMFGNFHGPANVQRALKLRMAWQSFKAFCAKHRLDQSQPLFTPARLMDDGWPALKAKAANCCRVLVWLAGILHAAPAPDLHTQLRKHTVVGFADAWTLTSAASGTTLSPDQARRFHRLINMALVSYSMLSREAARLGRQRWQLKPKHHALAEIADMVMASGRNPRSEWCFKLESCLGIMVRVAAKVHISTMGTRVLDLFLLRWYFDLK